ncbi:MAG: protein kinase, partial [Actinomycetota bacterium]
MNGAFELDGFEPIKRIGGGGFGDVWLARQTNVDRQVAVKVGHAPIQDETIRLRFDRECKALGRLSGHPNIIDVYTAGSLGDGRPYLVLEYISGGTLWQRLKRSPLNEDELISIGGQLAGALHVAHS